MFQQGVNCDLKCTQCIDLNAVRMHAPIEICILYNGIVVQRNCGQYLEVSW